MIDSVEMLIRQPGQSDRVVRLQEGATRMGRAEDNEVVLSDVGVSRRHAQVYVSRNEVTVEDLGSGNGTYYNGYRVQSQPLTDGDEIVIDPFVLQFRIRGAERAASAGAGARAESAGAHLEVVVGTGMAGSTFPITARGLSIGRSEDRDVVIPDPAASRHHCQITPEGSDFTLRDMGSANGVFVNAVRVRECQLADGDLVRIGNTEMRFALAHSAHRPRPAAPVPPPSRHGSNAPPAMPSAPTAGPGPSRSSTAATRMDTADNGARRVIAIIIAGVVAFVALIAVGIVSVVGVLLFLQNAPGKPAEFTPHAPRWKLELPPSLPPARVDSLLNEGVQKMKERDQRGALQDFYRILNAEPGRMRVGQFAFAAGEAMVLEALDKDFQRLEEERQAIDAERAQLLNRATSQRFGYSTQQKAQLTLRRKFATDPVVIEVASQQGWFEPSEEYQEFTQAVGDAHALMAEGKFAEAAPQLQRILDSTSDPAIRKQALSNLKLANQELARQTAPIWAEAVVLEASGQRGEAKSRFKELADQYPTLPSSRAHLERY